jgi:chemotaxis-related protein WspD
MSKIPKKEKYVTNCWNSIGVWGQGEEKCVELKQYVHCRNCPVFSEMGRAVFEKSAPSGYLAQWRKEIAEETQRDINQTESVLVFRSGHEWFALPANILSEVSNAREIHRIPRNANRFITGVVNINGEIKVCYSLVELLDLKITENDVVESEYQPKRLIVIELDEIHYVFLVDEVKGLHWYGESELLPVPSTLNTDNALLLLGSIIQLDQKIAIFNIGKFQEKLERAAL